MKQIIINIFLTIITFLMMFLGYEVNNLILSFIITILGLMSIIALIILTWRDGYDIGWKYRKEYEEENKK